MTAGCAGIGASIAETLAALGADVIATSRDAGRAKAFEAAQAGRIRGRVLAFDPASAKDFVETTRARSAASTCW